MSRAPRIALALVAASAAFATASAASASTFYGRVGPGMVITLKRANGNDVTSVVAGRHTFVIRDRSTVHNFVLFRGQTELKRTGVTFRGKKTWTLRIKKGARYRFLCSTHSSAMRGSFRVT
jgi:plastocyanin